MKHLPKFSLLVLLAALVFSATFAQIDARAADEKTSETAPVVKDWRKKLGTFRVGIVGGSRPILQIRRAQPFRKALADALGMRVELFAARDQKALIDAHRNGRVEYAVYSATAYGLAWSLCKCVEPLAVPATADGATGFRSILLAKKKHASSLAELRDKTVVLPGKQSFSGHLLPKHLLSNSGTAFEEFGWKLDYQPSAQTGLKTFLGKRAAAYFGWQPTIETVSETQKSNEKSIGQGTLATLSKKWRERLHVVWQSDVVPHGPHAVRRDVDPKAKAILKNFLFELFQDNPTALEAIAPRYAGGFHPVEHRSYRLVLDLLEGLSSRKTTDNNIRNAASDQKRDNQDS